MKILLRLTGSVATILYRKLITELQLIGDVEIILTDKAKNFIKTDLENLLENKKIWSDIDEWTWRNPVGDYLGHLDYKQKWDKNDPIIHINLRDSASALVIAPCSANTLAKIANGLCDNLLTSVVRAWDLNRPLIIAPAMNTHMWNHPITKKHINTIKSFGTNIHIVYPQSKMLACNTEGMGALADISSIKNKLETALK